MASAARLFQSGPLELLQAILLYSSCRKDVLSFALLCKHAQHAWLAHNIGLRAAWNALGQEMPAAEAALIAHRASQIVADAECAEQLPPHTLPLTKLGSAAKTPSALELVGVQQMHRLALALDAAFCEQEYALPGRPEGGGAPEAPERMDEWRRGVHNAIYRSFTTSAALSSIYQAPYAKAYQTPGIRQESGTTEGVLTAQRRIQSKDLLESFAVFRDSMTEAEEDTAFGTYADWLLQDMLSDKHDIATMNARFATCSGRARSCLARQSESGDDGCPVQLVAGGSHAEAHAIALQLVRLWWVSRQIMDTLGSNAMEIPVDSEHLQMVPVGPVVPYGIFYPRMVYLPKPDYEPRYHLQFLATEPTKCANCPPGYYGFIRFRFQDIDRIEPIGYRVFAPLLQARFFAYFLRKHMKLAFHPQFFHGSNDSGWIHNGWSALQSSLMLFSLDNVQGRDETYYPDSAAGESFPYDGFLDGGDLLISSDKLNEMIASIT